MDSIIIEAFEKKNITDYSPIVLAYIGDAVFELIVRTMVLSKGNAPVSKLHKKSSEIVKAKSQSEMYFKIENMLTDEEMSVLKKGRNAKSYTTPKNADISDYRHATGVEALFGYLYLKGRLERAIELFKVGIAPEKKGE
jgi:ribonuclease-3 family protein